MIPMPDRLPANVRNVLCALTMALLPMAAMAQGGQVQPGHSAMWYDPSRSGEGWMLEILPDDRAVLYWFTFDNAGNPRWLGGVGAIVRDAETGDRIVFDALTNARGGRFGPGFDPDAVVRETIGRATLAFADCNNGRIDFDAYGKAGSFPLTRLTRTMGAACNPIHGTPGEPVQTHAGQSGSWYDPAYSGQGFSLEWMANGRAGLVWFTFDAHGDPYWVIGTGEMTGDRLVFENLYSVRGGRFAEAFDPAEVVRTPWGRLELTLDCASGDADYAPTEPGFASGRFDLKRLTQLEQPTCPWVKPKLTDLYDLEWTALPELPNPEDRGYEGFFGQNALADDGSVAGVDEDSRIILLRPDSTQWVQVGESHNVLFAPDGETIYFDTYRADGKPSVSRWSEASGEQPILDPSMEGSLTNTMSRNGVWILGSGSNASGGFNWKWSKASGLIAMAPGTGRPRAISDNGDIVIGDAGGGLTIPVPWLPRSLQWIGDAPPAPLWHADSENLELLGASACNADCSMVLGSQTRQTHVPQTWSNNVWYRLGNGTPLQFAVSAIKLHANRDGSLVAGANAVVSGRSDWLWTQDTGVVSLAQLIDEEMPGDAASLWPRNLAAMSSDGLSLLLYSGGSRTSHAQPHHGLAILRLAPKSATPPVAD